jgi:hypothetical protein
MPWLLGLPFQIPLSAFEQGLRKIRAKCQRAKSLEILGPGSAAASHVARCCNIVAPFCNDMPTPHRNLRSSVLERFLKKAGGGARQMAIVAGYMAALGVGALLAIVGGGGAILALPTLIYAFKLPAWTATTYSLFIVGGTAAIGAARHARAGMIGQEVRR